MAACNDHDAGQSSALDVEKLCASDSLFDSEFGRRVQAADRDGDGRLSVGEFRSVVWSEIEGWKRAKQLRAILIGFSLFTVLVVGANIAMAVTVAALSKEISVGANGIMTMKGGKGFVATGQAATSVDLSRAYMMDVNNLRQVSQVILTEGGASSTSIYQVQQVTLTPGVSVAFYMAGGITLTIDDSAGLAMQGASTGRKLLQTTSAQGVQTSASSLRTQDGVYGSGPYDYNY